MMSLRYAVVCWMLWAAPWVSAHAGATTWQPGVTGEASSVAALRASSTSELDSLLANELTGMYQADRVEVQVTPQGRWGLQARWLPDVDANLRAVRPVAGGWQVEVSVSPHGAHGLASPQALMRYKVLRLMGVWTATAALQRGDEVSCAAVRAEKKVPVSGSVYWSGDCQDLMALRLRHPLRPGDTLMVADLSPPGMVQAGQSARVVTRAGGIEISASCEALADGQLGQRIPVRIHGRAVAIRAMVTAPGTLYADEEI